MFQTQGLRLSAVIWIDLGWNESGVSTSWAIWLYPLDQGYVSKDPFLNPEYI